MQPTSAFSEFLERIRPTEGQRAAATAGHRALRERLLADSDLRHCIVGIFLQGSFRRATAIRSRDGRRVDVDVVVVTDIAPRRTSPNDVLGRFKTFLRQYYRDVWTSQGRSLGIELDGVHLELVVTSAPCEIEVLRGECAGLPLDEAPQPTTAETAAWTLSPLLIPSRETSRWEPTHPLAQIAWTRQRNASCNGHFVNVVKAIKWWHRRHRSLPTHPKGYPLERLVDDCCPDGIRSVAEGVAGTFEAIRDKYAWHARTRQTPVLPNHGVPSQNVLARVPAIDFAAFVNLAETGAHKARRAIETEDERESRQLWRELFGEDFK
ncbi:nucleotidyltransferase [Nannocystis sp. RBIL2]|uniref:SMODS domain-containing nucleotidyltransferase n=1 Tax=Nannocystis sp. RBIL2 TaxID=2996788 RepID=UPI00226E1617|nr:nucleotidyltransferase [Nannocystis sp. RBIL2]MCY1071190.1 nucleotidyltransferase [Nannocystis sp. RBIL2]